MWRFDISGEAAEALSDFSAGGRGNWSLRMSTLDTRFLGDLYKISPLMLGRPVHRCRCRSLLRSSFSTVPSSRRYASSVSYPTSVIDPTCGSGHFLLGTFDRPIRMWKDREPATDIRVLTERALKEVTGVDLNSFAVAVARFRLVVAALKVGGSRSPRSRRVSPISMAPPPS